MEPSAQADPQAIVEFILLMMMFLVVVVFGAIIRAESDEREREAREEEERRARVKALYPDPPSYEERMGVRYGQKEEEDDTLQ